MKKNKNKKKLTVFTLTIFAISLYFYLGINIEAESEGSKNVKNPQKILIAVYFGEDSGVLCASPLNNTCFYPNVYYEVNETEGELYTYFEKEYREVIKYEEAYFIKEDKYLENMKNKVGEIKNGRVRFNKAVYKKEECETKRESIVKTAELIISEVGKINGENKISLFLSKGNFTEFIRADDIDKEEFADMLYKAEDTQFYTQESLLSDVISLSENNKEDTTLIVLNAGKNPAAFTKENTKGFNSTFVINFLSPCEIEGERHNETEENYGSYNTFSDEREQTLALIFEKINKNALKTESISDEQYLLSTE